MATNKFLVTKIKLKTIVSMKFLWNGFKLQVLIKSFRLMFLYLHCVFLIHLQNLYILSSSHPSLEDTVATNYKFPKLVCESWFLNCVLISQRYTNADIKILQYCHLHIIVICQRSCIIIWFTFWDTCTRDIWNVFYKHTETIEC